MQGAVEQMELCLNKAQKKRDTVARQKICEANHWLIAGSLHKPAEFTSDEDRRNFESGVKSPQGKRARCTQT